VGGGLFLPPNPRNRLFCGLEKCFPVGVFPSPRTRMFFLDLLRRSEQLKVSSEDPLSEPVPPCSYRVFPFNVSVPFISNFLDKTRLSFVLRTPAHRNSFSAIPPPSLLRCLGALSFRPANRYLPPPPRSINKARSTEDRERATVSPGFFFPFSHDFVACDSSTC